MEDNAGVVKGLIYGIGALLIVVVVTLIVVSTMLNSNLLRATDTTTTTTGEGGTLVVAPYTLANFDGYNRNFAIVTITNTTNAKTITAPNYTFSAVTGTLVNKTAILWPAVTINYTYIPEGRYEKTARGTSDSLQEGIGNVSTKIPTILLIGAVVMLFGIILLLVRYSQSMGFMGRQGGSL